SKLLQARSILAFPVVERFTDAGDDSETDEEHLAGARVVADLARVTRSVHQERHARIASPEGMGDTRPRRTADDRAGTNRVLLDSALLPEEHMAAALENDEDLLLRG